MTVSPSADTFATTYDRGAPQAVWTRLLADLDTPVSAMLKLAVDQPFSFLLESVEGGAARGRYSAIGFRPDLIWRCRGDRAEVNRHALDDTDAFEPVDAPPLEALRHLWAESRIDLPEDFPPIATGLFGYLGYDMVRQMERIPETNPDPLGVPDGIMIRPTIICAFDNVTDAVTIVTLVWPRDGVLAREAYDAACDRLAGVITRLETGLSYSAADTSVEQEQLDAPVSNTPRDRVFENIARAKEYIRAGDIFQVVLSERFTTRFTLPPINFYRSLRRLNPSPFMFFLNFGSLHIIGSSPEILVRLRGDTVTIRPIAGTRRRGATAAEDRALAEELLADPKERAEHLMLLDLGRNDVGRVSRIGTVQVTEQYTIEYYSHVMHIVSNVIGTIRSEVDALDALQAGFPAGTVSGAPKVRAMEIIEELELARRGVYAGAIGYLGATGDMDTCIALRTAVIKDGLLHIQAGAGIVADSDPESEYQENRSKARALVRAAEDAVRYANRRTAPGGNFGA